MAGWQLQTSEPLGEIRKRAQQSVSIRLLDADAIATSIYTSLIEAPALLEYACEGQVRLETTQHAAFLAMNTFEYCSIFGAATVGRCGHTSSKLAATCQLPEARQLLQLVEKSLQTTLNEALQGTLWKRSLPTRVAALLSLCRPTDAIECLDAVVGGVVTADSRSIDDLKTRLEDEGLDILLVTELVHGLVASVLGG